jgi:restriction system protein
VTADITFHYPPELFNLLVDTIPLLNRSKKDVLIFFRGAGVPDAVLADLRQQLGTAAREDLNKFEIVRTVLRRLNERGERTLRERREVLRRIVEFANFDTCWPADQLKAKGLVAGIRDVVNQKDSFTRMNQAREDEPRARLADAEKAERARAARTAGIAAAKAELYSLFRPTLTPQERGKRLEAAMNRLFQAFGILVKEAFHLVGEPGEGIVEQIDGVIELSAVLHFVEMKWYKEPVGTGEVAQHLVRLMSRAEARGLFISASDYTDPAIRTCREFLQHKTLALVHLQEIVQVLERGQELGDFLLEKIQAAQIHKNPYVRLTEQPAGT